MPKRILPVCLLLLQALPFARAGDQAATPSLSTMRCPNCNLILISLSNIGAERMSLYGYRRKTTPKLDSWASRSLVFDNAFTHASWTLPVGVSLFTSMYPYTHKIVARKFQNTLNSAITTLPEILRGRGYRTGAFTGGGDYAALFSHMRGFQEKPANEDFTGFSTTIPQAKAWLARNRDHPFMLFLHGYDAHCPFNPPAPFRGTFSGVKGKDILVDETRCVRGFESSQGSSVTAVYAGGCTGITSHCHQTSDEIKLTKADIQYLSDLYDDKVFEVDALVGRFLASLDENLLKKTIVVVFSDHGEMFAKHGRFGRAGTVRGTHYDDVLHVPLIMYFPGQMPARIEGLAQIIDVMPTILSSLGIKTPALAQGKDLEPLLSSGAVVNSYAYAGANYHVDFKIPGEKSPRYWTQTESIRDLRWELIREIYYNRPKMKRKYAPPAVPLSETVELYDVRQDPDELENIVKDRPEIARDLTGRLEAWKHQAESTSVPRPYTSKVSRDLLRAAQNHGYWDLP